MSGRLRYRLGQSFQQDIGRGLWEGHPGCLVQGMGPFECGEQVPVALCGTVEAGEPEGGDGFADLVRQQVPVDGDG
jgi:hypothetical protein